MQEKGPSDLKRHGNSSNFPDTRARGRLRSALYLFPPCRSWCSARRFSTGRRVQPFASPAVHRLQVMHPVKRSPRLSISTSSCPQLWQRSMAQFSTGHFQGRRLRAGALFGQGRLKNATKCRSWPHLFSTDQVLCVVTVMGVPSPIIRFPPNGTQKPRSPVRGFFFWATGFGRCLPAFLWTAPRHPPAQETRHV